MNRLAVMLAMAVALLCGSTASFAQDRPSADTPGKTSSGIVYTQPKDWAVTANGPATVFVAPENNLSIAVVDVGSAATAQAAADKAWSIYKPGATRPVRLSTAGSPGNGWDEVVGIAYET